MQYNNAFILNRDSNNMSKAIMKLRNSLSLRLRQQQQLEPVEEASDSTLLLLLLLLLFDLTLSGHPALQR